jgi:predicted chitinase
MFLKEGMKGTEVALWQKFLKSQGFTVGVDGEFGKVTTRITVEFQKEHKLEADGIVGEGTIAAAAKLSADFKKALNIKTKSAGINDDTLKKLFSQTAADLRNRFVAPFNLHLPAYKIDTKLRVAAFIATGGIETDYLRTTMEYASGKAYEGRTDLGNVMPGDGMKFKGHGFFQTTGRFNHRKVTEKTFAKLHIDFEKEPQRLTEIDIAVESACIFWNDNNLSKWADKPDFFGVSGKVNRGDATKEALHYDKRKALYDKCIEILPDKIFD